MALPRGSVQVAVLSVALYLLITLPWEPALDFEFYHNTTSVPGTGPLSTPEYDRGVVTLPSHGETLEAWLYTPTAAAGATPHPVVVMAQGMGVQKDFGLDLYAAQFAAAGAAVLVFDYRCFGGSSGLPRNWVSPKRHVEDWTAVVQHVLDGGLGASIDTSKVALWGVSYSGGHALVTAAKFGPAIKAVIANEPYLSPTVIFSDDLLRTLPRMARLFAVGISDKLRQWAGLPPVYLPLALPMSLAKKRLVVLPLQDSEVTNRTAVPRQGGWQNKILGRFILEAVGYNPGAHLHKLDCPVFFRVALQDHLCPAHVIREAAQKVPKGFLIQERDTTHLGAHKMGCEPEEMRAVLEFLGKQWGTELRQLDPAEQQEQATEE